MFINIAHAAVTPIVQCFEPDACNWNALVDMVARVIDYLIILAVVVAAFGIGANGFTYLLAHGDPGTIAAAKKGLNRSIIGFIWLLAAWLIVHALLKAFGLLPEFSIIPL